MIDIADIAVRLQRLKGSWRQLSAKSGVPYFTLTKVARGTIKNPGIDTINKLLPHLHALDQEVLMVAPESVIATAEASGWQKTPHEIRPDLYPNPDDGIPPDVRAKMDGIMVGWREPDATTIPRAD